MESRSEVILILSLLVGIGLLAQRYSRFVADVFGIKGESLIGIEFVFIGLLLGPQGLNFFPPELLSSLFPAFVLALGWIGLAVMIEMDLRGIPRLPLKLGAVSFAASAVAFLLIYLFFRAFFSVVPLVSRFDWALVLAALSLPVAPEMLAAQLRRRADRTRENNALLALGIFDDLHSVLFYFVVYPLILSQFVQVSYWQNLMLTLGIGLLSGFLLNLLTIPSRKRSELLLILLGVVLFASGLSAMMRVSPLLSCSICGLFAANSSLKRLRMSDVLLRAERPIFYFFLVLVGALLDLQALWSDNMLLLTTAVALIFVVMRMAGKYAGYHLATRFYGPRNAGNRIALLSLSGIFIAMLVDLRLGIEGPESNELLFAGMLAFVLSIVTSHLVVRLRIKPQSERSRRV